MVVYSQVVDLIIMKYKHSKSEYTAQQTIYTAQL